MSKKCNACQQPYVGFGTTCPSCRKRPSEGTTTGPKSDANANHCHACGKRVYAMEQRMVEGMVFHHGCFRCTTCNRQLDSNFAKSELGFFCLTHFHQIAKVTGGYKTGTGPTRNAAAADLVEALVHRDSRSPCGVSAPAKGAALEDQQAPDATQEKAAAATREREKVAAELEVSAAEAAAAAAAEAAARAAAEAEAKAPAAAEAMDQLRSQWYPQGSKEGQKPAAPKEEMLPPPPVMVAAAHEEEEAEE